MPLTWEQRDALDRSEAAAKRTRAEAILHILTSWHPPERPPQLSPTDVSCAGETFGADARAVLTEYRPSSKQLRRACSVDRHSVVEIVVSEIELDAAILTVLSQAVRSTRVARRSHAGKNTTKPRVFGGNSAGRLVGILAAPAMRELCDYLVNSTGRGHLGEAGKIVFAAVPELCRSPADCVDGNRIGCQWHRSPGKALKALLRSVPIDARAR